MTTEQIVFEPALLEALNKHLMRMVGESNEDDYSGKMLTPEEKDSLATAAVAYKAGNYHVAVPYYKTCVSSMNRTHTDGNELSKLDVILQFMLCKCLTHSQQFQDLIEARTMLTELEASVGKTYPMIYHGLAELYVKIFCFDKAEQFITKGFAVMKEDMEFPKCYIPETDDLVSESTKQDLTEQLLNLREQCSGWHPPDAKCFMDNCSTVSANHLCGRNIFIKSPAFSGMVALTCSNTINPCTITFHSVCWKIKKDEVSSGMKIPDKDIILNWLCLTPNCGDDDKPSVIRKIKILKEDGSFKNIEAPIEKLSRNTPQQSSVSKGAIRKQKNRTSTPKVSKIKSVLSNNNNSIHVTNNNHNHQIHHNSQVNNSNVKNNSLTNEVLKEIPKQQEPQKPSPLVDPITIKLMKMISLRETNFNIEFENDWRSDEAYYGNEHMRNTIDSCYEPDFSNDLQQVAHIKSFLFSYFVTYIENRGPIKNDELLKEWLSITESIGGCEAIVNNLCSIIEARQFLLQSLKFVAVGDYICIPVLLPGAYALMEAEAHHKVTTSIAKGDSEFQSKNERKKKENRNSINESDTQVKEEEIVQEDSVKIADDKPPGNLVEKNDTEADDPFLLTPDDFLDISASDQDNWTDSDNTSDSIASSHTSTEIIEDGKNSEITEVAVHVNEIQGEGVIQDDGVREGMSLDDGAGETLDEIEDESMKIVEEKIDNDKSEIEDSTNGSKSECTEHQTSEDVWPSEDGSFAAEEIVETERLCQREMLEIEDKNVSEELKVEGDCQQVEIEEKIDTNEITEVEVYEIAERTLGQTINGNLQENSNDNQSDFSEAPERYVIENESEETFSEQDDVSTDEDTGTYHPSVSLTPIREEDSIVKAKYVYQGNDDIEQENDDTESSCSSTIDQVMNEFINMSSNKSQFLVKASEPAERLDNDIIAEQAATIEELSEELHNTRNELEKTMKEVKTMKLNMLRKSLDGQYNSNNTFISCKMEAIRSDYAVVAKLQNIVFNTAGNYLNIDWQDWVGPLENLEKIRSSLQDEYTKLAELISSKENCEDMEDVCLNMLNVPPLPQHNIPNLIEVAFNTIKHRVQQSVVSYQPPILPPQNPHMTRMMSSFWYQQTQFLQQPSPTAPYHHLINPLVPSTQVQKVVAAPTPYPPSPVPWMNSSPPATVQPVSPTIPYAMGQPLMKSAAINANVNQLAWSNALEPCLPIVPPVSAAKSTATQWASWTSMEASKGAATAAKLVTAIPDLSPAPKSENEVCTQSVALELSNSGQSTLLTAQNSKSLPKTCTATIFSEDARFPPQSHLKIVPEDTASNEIFPPLKKQKSTNADVKTAESIKTETHDNLPGKNQSAKSHVDLVAKQVIRRSAQTASQPLKGLVLPKTEAAIKKEVKKPLEIPAHKSKESSQVNVKILPKQSVIENPQVSLLGAKDPVSSNQKELPKTVTVSVSDQSKTSKIITVTCKNTSVASENSVAVFSNDRSLTTSKLVPSTSSSEASKCITESIKGESLEAPDAPTAYSNGMIEKSAPVVKEKDLLKTVPEDKCDLKQLNQTGQSKIQQTQKNLEIKQSVNHEKPSTSSQTPITNGHVKVKTPEKSKMHSKDKLMHILRKKYVGVLEWDLQYSVTMVRKNHNDTLSGLFLSQIVEEASLVINNRQRLQSIPYLPNNGPTTSKNQCLYVSAKAERPRNDSISSTSSANSAHRELVTKMNPWIKPQDVCWTKDAPEVECVICMEVLITKEPTYTLKCQHTFHKQCIRDWFIQNQSCPTCRIHSTIDDEFPPLP